MATNLTLGRVSALCSLALGSVLINTLPIWLGEIATDHSLSSDDVGLLATVFLLTAGFACFVHAVFRHPATDILFGVAAILLLLGIHLPANADIASILFASALIGWSIGTVIANGLEEAFSRDDALKTVSLALALGLLVSLVMIVASTASGLPVLLQITLCAIPVVGLMIISVVRSGKTGQASVIGAAPINSAEFIYLPFFIMMGGFWAFLEVYAVEQSLPDIKPVLALSLLASAAGSAWVNRVSGGNKLYWTLAGLILSAAGAAGVYLSAAAIVVSAMLLINSFFLFLFLPLYLTTGNEVGDIAVPQGRTALYLLGFALGGVVGGLLISLAGYAAFAVLILLSALPPCLKLISQRQETDSGQSQ